MWDLASWCLYINILWLTQVADGYLGHCLRTDHVSSSLRSHWKAMAEITLVTGETCWFSLPTFETKHFRPESTVCFQVVSVVLRLNHGFAVFCWQDETQWIGLKEKLNRKPSIFPWNMGFSSKFSLKPFQSPQAGAEVLAESSADVCRMQFGSR